jgi:hypothetical protein
MKVNAQAQQAERKMAHDAEQTGAKLKSDESKEAMRFAATEEASGTGKAKKKKLVRGNDGKATHVESDTGEKWTIVRGPDGRAEGIEVMH